MNFGEKILDLRKKKGLSQEEFGNIIEVSRQTVSKWETFQSQPEVNQVKRISEEFNISIEYLLNDEIENANIMDKKIRKINIKKILIYIIIVLILMYLLISLYKFIVLKIYSKKVNTIPENFEYTICSNWVYKDNHLGTEEKFSGIELYSGDIQLIRNYNCDYEFPCDIIYKNEKTKEIYILNYDEELKKYILDDKWEEDESFETIYEKNTLKNMATSCFPSGTQIIKDTFNPKTLIYFNGDYLCVKQTYNPSTRLMQFEKDRGLLRKMDTAPTTKEIEVKSDYQYFYDIAEGKDKQDINNFNINDYDYVLKSEIE